MILLKTVLTLFFVTLASALPLFGPEEGLGAGPGALFWYIVEDIR
jgi:hypothetical protein